MNSSEAMDSKRTLKALRRILRGQYQRIADECGVTRSYVSQVLHDQSNNDKVMNKAIEIKNQLLAAKQEQLKRAAEGLIK